MAEANWEQRSYWKLGPNFGIDVKNPQIGLDGPDIYSMYGVTDGKDINVIGLSNGSGLFKIYNDRSIEIIGGQNNPGGGTDIIITGKNGDITITAERSGSVRIRAKNIIIDADENIDLIAGKNINLKSGKRFVVQSNHVDAVARTGNLNPRGMSQGERIYGGDTPSGVDVVQTNFHADHEGKYTGGTELAPGETATEDLQVGESNTETRALAAQEQEFTERQDARILQQGGTITEGNTTTSFELS